MATPCFQFLFVLGEVMHLVIDLPCKNFVNVGLVTPCFSNEVFGLGSCRKVKFHWLNPSTLQNSWSSEGLAHLHQRRGR